MTKTVDASCVNNEVSIGGFKVPAKILSQGKKQSSGIALVDKNQVTYLTSNASDIAELITLMKDILDKVTAIATGLDAGTTSPGGQASNIAQLSPLISQLNALKDNLK